MKNLARNSFHFISTESKYHLKLFFPYSVSSIYNCILWELSWNKKKTFEKLSKKRIKVKIFVKCAFLRNMLYLYWIKFHETQLSSVHICSCRYLQYNIVHLKARSYSFNFIFFLNSYSFAWIWYIMCHFIHYRTNTMRFLSCCLTFCMWKIRDLRVL